MSLYSKLSLTFVSMVFGSILLAGVFGIWNTNEVRDRRQFDQQAMPLLTAQLVDYYKDNDGTWPKDGEWNPPLPAYVMLFDENRNKVGGPKDQKRWPVFAMAKKRAIFHDDKLIGFLHVVGIPDPKDHMGRRAAARSPILWGGFGLLLLMAGGTGIFMSKRIAGPLQELTVATRAVATGDLEHRVPVRTQDEIGILAQAFNGMSAQLQESQRQKRQMTQDIVHDLAQPIVVIRGLAEGMRDGVLPRSPANLDVIYQEAGRLETLSRSLHVLELADSRRLRLHLAQVAPADLLEHCRTMYAEPARRAGLELACHVPAGLPALLVDEERIVQALGNLVTNAFAHAPAGSTVTIAAAARDGDVHISVADAGPGVSAEELDRIFERFYRADKSRRQTQAGSGIGLAIVRSLLEAHGGQVWAEDVKPQGLKVVLSLPIPPASGDA